jgi:hypothetical protein
MPSERQRRNENDGPTCCFFFKLDQIIYTLSLIVLPVAICESIFSHAYLGMFQICWITLASLSVALKSRFLARLILYFGGLGHIAAIAVSIYLLVSQMALDPPSIQNQKISFDNAFKSRHFIQIFLIIFNLSISCISMMMALNAFITKSGELDEPRDLKEKGIFSSANRNAEKAAQTL